MKYTALSRDKYIFATQLSPQAVYFIQTGGSALSNTYRQGAWSKTIPMYTTPFSQLTLLILFDFYCLYKPLMMLPIYISILDRCSTSGGEPEHP